MRVFALQFEPIHGDVDQNWSRALELLEHVPQDASGLAVFPEMALSGYIWPDAQSVYPVARYCSDLVTQNSWVIKSQEKNVWFVIGHPAVDEETGELRNRCTLVSPEGIVGHYDKTCLYPADLTWAQPGQKIPPVWQTPWGAVSPLVCADLDYPEPIQSAVQSGAHLIVFPTAWVEEPGPSATWTLRANEMNIPIVAADIIGQDNGTVFSGGSAIISKDGNILETNDYTESLITHVFDLDESQPKALHPVITSTLLKSPNAHSLVTELSLSIYSSHSSGGSMERLMSEQWPESDVYLLPNLFLDSPDMFEDFKNELVIKVQQSGCVIVGSTLDSAQNNPSCVVWSILDDGTFHEIAREDTYRKSKSLEVEVATFTFGGFRIAVLGAWALEQTAPVRAISLENTHLVLATGSHALPHTRNFVGTSAQFGNGLENAEKHFAHPVRFRAGDSQVWIGFASAEPNPPSGLFSPNHVRWPRRENLADKDGWMTAQVTISPENPWGIDAIEKPMLHLRRTDLYKDNWTLITNRENHD